MADKSSNPVPEQIFEPDTFYDASCTVIYGADETNAFGGNNEDYANPDTRIWFIPPEPGRHGRALVGYEGFVWQGGMNDQGLFFDAMAVDEPVQVEQGSKPRYEGSLPAKALAECGDVACVVDLFDKYHAYDTWSFQFMFGDAEGASVIIEPKEYIYGGSYLVGTNFFQSTTDLSSCRFCFRYWTARNMFENADGLSVDLMRDILNETHLDEEYPTQYSTIYDLKQKMIHLYHFHNFENVRTFDLNAELAQGYHTLIMENLFPDNIDFYIYAARERSPLVEIRSTYPSLDLNPSLYIPFLGHYQGPDDLEMMFSHYSVDYVQGDLVLMMLPDKAWMKLEPISGTDFYHISYFDHFEISFIKNESGEVDEFIFRKDGTEYPFKRIELETSNEEGLVSGSKWSAVLEGFTQFTGTYTFKFIAIILGLILLRMVLQYLRSLLI